MHLLTGPAGSGKTTRILDCFREALRRRDPGVRLLTPTATMAQHLQNRLAREGFVFRPGLIQTLSRFVDSFVAGMPQVSEPLLYLIVEAAAGRVNRPEFARVVRLPGFCAALARTIEEFSSAGCDAELLAARLPRTGGKAPLGEAFLAVYQAVDRELQRRGLATRSQRLAHAAEQIAREGAPGIHTIWLDGFHALPDPELAVIEALARHAEVTLTLPIAEITAPTRDRLLTMGFVEETCNCQSAAPRLEVCAAPSIEREADEIARRILEQSGAGRPFRDMGVIVRNPEVYEAILRATFDRFGIPARFYFDAELMAHPLIRHLLGLVDALLGGWDHAETLAAIRLAPGSCADEFDFAVRAQIPGSGLAALKILPQAPAALLESLERLEPWRTQSLPPIEWAERLKGLRALCTPAHQDPSTHEAADIARGQAAVLDLFAQSLDEAADALSQTPIRLGDFWRAAKSVMRLTPLRVSDMRRNVVHALGAHESRQWRLPVMFVCGLVEKQFPKFHTQDPFFPEGARALLKQASIRVRTAADFEAEERFLFDWAITRATESLTLSYPQADARGQQNLPSLYLESIAAERSDATAVQPEPARFPDTVPAPTVITSPDLLESVAARHIAFRPTALETYLQCSFQFFGRDTLRLECAPKRPEQRLDFLTQGNIVHGTLARMSAGGAGLERVFDSVFREICERAHIPDSYRTAAGRERMLSDLRALFEDPEFTNGYEIRAEQKFRYKLNPDVEIRGRIDRIDVTPDGGAYMIDYKYSGAQNTKSRATDENLLQPQLYLLALERFFALRPEGMSYWGFKGAIQRTPWIPLDPRHAIETTLRIAGEIRAGRIEPLPADPDKCRFCDFRDVCRYIAAAPEIAEGEAHCI